MELSNLFDKYKQYLSDQDLSDLTITGYLSDLRIFAKWFRECNDRELTLEAITPTDIKEYRRSLQLQERRSANTINRRLSSLSTFIQWGLGQKRILSNPMQNIHMIRSTPSAPRWLDKQEQFALQRALERDLQLAKLRYPKRWITRRRDASLVLFLLHTGLRLSEAVALQMEDIQLSERKGSVLVRNGKGSRQRQVPLNAEARKALSAWFAVRPGNGFVWTAVEGDPELGLSGRAVQRVLNRYAQEANLEALSPHVLRHTFGKNLVNAGVGLEKVASLLGHENLNTTRIYITPSKQDLEQAVELVS
ncbi:MAG TPA: tyrosine-type recombinase/integrase [Anaerolineales bacterium]|nr:tyrosine-type recombinase/integrase [Anaerolineales bacterium]